MLFVRVLEGTDEQCRPAKGGVRSEKAFVYRSVEGMDRKIQFCYLIVRACWASCHLDEQARPSVRFGFGAFVIYLTRNDVHNNREQTGFILYFVFIALDLLC